MQQQPPHRQSRPLTLAWIIFAFIGGVPLLPSLVSAYKPTLVPIENSGFEQQALRLGERSDRIVGWTQSAPPESGSGVIHDGADHINVAKEGHQWASLRSGQAIAQIIGQTDANMFNDQCVDRLFVSLIVSSLQDDTSNEVNLTVSLYASDSRSTWESGTLISSGQIHDRTNDN